MSENICPDCKEPKRREDYTDADGRLILVGKCRCGVWTARADLVVRLTKPDSPSDPA